MNEFQTRASGALWPSRHGTRVDVCFGLFRRVQIAAILYLQLTAVATSVVLARLTQGGFPWVENGWLAVAVWVAIIVIPPSMFTIGRWHARHEEQFLRAFLQETLGADREDGP